MICGAFWIYFGSILGVFWEYFGMTLDVFWEYFGIISGVFWEHFGSMLGSWDAPGGPGGPQEGPKSAQERQNVDFETI